MKKIYIILVMCIFLVSVMSLFVLAFGDASDSGTGGDDTGAGDDSSSDSSTDTSTDTSNEDTTDMDSPAWGGDDTNTEGGITDEEMQDVLDEMEDDEEAARDFSKEDVSKEDIVAIGKSIMDAVEKEKKDEFGIETPLGTVTIDTKEKVGRIDITERVSITFGGSLSDLSGEMGVKVNF